MQAAAWFLFGLLVALSSAQEYCSSTRGPNFNVQDKAIYFGEKDISSDRYVTFKWKKHNYLLTSGSTYDEFWIVDDPFNPVLDRNISGLNPCRGLPFYNENVLGEYFLSTPSNSQSCYCTLGQPCQSYFPASGPTGSINYVYCDNTLVPTATFEVTAPVMYVDSLACENATERPDFVARYNLTGRLALIPRGQCFFQEKADNARAAGAVGVVLFNRAGTTGCDNAVLTNLSIPLVMISNADGLSVQNQLKTGAVIGTLGASARFAYDGSTRSPFGDFWGVTPGLTVAPLDAESAEDYVSHITPELAPFLSQSSLARGFQKRPDNEVLDVWLQIRYDTSQGIFMRLEDGVPNPVSRPFSLPQSVANGGKPALFKRDNRLFMANPAAFDSIVELFVVNPYDGGATPVVTKLASTPGELLEVSTAIPISPDNTHLYTENGIVWDGSCQTVGNVFDISNPTNPTFSSAHPLNILPSGGNDQTNNYEIQRTNDGNYLMCLAHSSEGVQIVNVNDPTNLENVATSDPTAAWGEYTVGAFGCKAGTSGDGTFFYQSLSDRSIWVARPKNLGGESGASTLFASTSTAAVLVAFVALFGW